MKMLWIFILQKNMISIVSISTLEHVGWDENTKDPDKIFQAIKNLKSYLVPRGKLIVTMPIGYNPCL